MRIDTESVTRCEDCAQFRTNYENGVSYCSLHNHIAHDRGFCAWARKAGE